MKLTSLEAIIESILFVAGEPVELEDISSAIEQDLKSTRSLVDYLKDKYLAEKRGMIIIEMDGAYQMCTNPDYFEWVKKLYQNSRKKPLTQPLLETLAIVAYKQPVTKGDIEEIRGVNADHAVNKLLEYGLITERGRRDTPGKPLQFGTSPDFLKYFGITDLSNLPVLDSNIEQLKKEAEEEMEMVEKGGAEN